MKDKYFAWIMHEDGSYEKKSLGSHKNRSQIELIEKWQNY